MSFSQILVTGAAGFLGSAVVRQAVNASLPMTATDRTISTKLPGVNFIPADILDLASLLKVFEGVDCVCHVAGLAHIFDKSKALLAPFHEVNVTGAINVAHAAAKAGVKHFVFISSVSVYGGEAHGQVEDGACKPETPYAASKWEAEQRLSELCQKEGMSLTILRLATLYGEEDPGNVARLIGSISQGRFIWVGKGENLKSLLHREDAARACIEVMKKPMPGITVYNVSSLPGRMYDIVESIASALGKSVPPWHIPASLALNAAKMIKTLSLNRGRLSSIHGTIQKWLADDYYNVDKMRRAYNFRTKVTLEAGIAREVEWYKAKFLQKQ